MNLTLVRLFYGGEIMKRMILVVLLVVALTGVAAYADTFQLTCTTTSACSGGPFGTITLTQDGSSVDVSLTLATNFVFAKTGAGDALEFNLTGNPAITISGLSSAFSVGPAPDTAPPFGAMMYSVTCSGCGNGTSAPNFSSLSFTVGLTGGGTLNVADFIANAGGFFFTSDVGFPPNSDGVRNTQNVAANTPVPSVPEPTSMALLGTGLFGVAGAIRRKLSK
jgi:hypothetical protein